jgi:hypothetical protein
MDSLGYRLVSILIWSPRSYRASLSRPKNWKSEIPRFRARERRARDWAGVPAFATAWGWDAGGETARETENLATWEANRAGVGARPEKSRVAKVRR